MEKKIKNAYYSVNSPAYMAGSKAVYREVKKHGIKLKEVENYLAKQKTATLHKPICRRFKRNRVVAAGLDTDWQADLVEMGKFKQENDSVSYLLTCIDVLSKYSWVVPLKSKTAADVAEAFSVILLSKRKPWKLMTDAGKEFIGKPFQKLMEESDIQHFTSKSPDIKGSIVERYNRTLKTRLWKHFTHTKTHRYIDILPKIVDAINSSVHRMTGMAPKDVNFKNAQAVRERLYGNVYPTNKRFRFKKAQFVRIAKEKHKLSKGYTANFSDEVFQIVECVPREPPVYRIKDLNGEDIGGIFYEQELVPALMEDDVYIVEKVLKHRTRKGIKEILVKWKGYANKHNQWVKEEDFI